MVFEFHPSPVQIATSQLYGIVPIINNIRDCLVPFIPNNQPTYLHKFSPEKYHLPTSEIVEKINILSTQPEVSAIKNTHIVTIAVKFDTQNI